MLLLQWGCLPSSDIGQSSKSGAVCPPTPPIALRKQNVETIDPRPETMTSLSGEASTDLNAGYLFSAEAEQIINFHSRNNNLCIWVYAPDNSQLSLDDLEPLDNSYAFSKSTKVLLAGQYILQVGSLNDMETFELDLSIEPGRRQITALGGSQITDENSDSLSDYDFSKEKFPKAECGDAMPSGASSFPVTFFPIHVAFSEENLELAKDLYCEDAFKTTDKNDGSEIVQIASFTNQSKAKAFLQYIEKDFPEAKVGLPKTFDEAPSSQLRNTSSNKVLIGEQRVEFSPGSTGTSIRARLLSNQLKKYLLWCRGGQSMVVSLTKGDISGVSSGWGTSVKKKVHGQ